MCIRDRYKRPQLKSQTTVMRKQKKNTAFSEAELITQFVTEVSEILISSVIFRNLNKGHPVIVYVLSCVNMFRCSLNLNNSVFQSISLRSISITHGHNIDIVLHNLIMKWHVDKVQGKWYRYTVKIWICKKIWGRLTERW